MGHLRTHTVTLWEFQMKFGTAAAVAAVALALTGAANAQQHVARDTNKATIIALLSPHVETFDKVLAHPIGLHYRKECQDWREGTVRPPHCADRRGMLVKRALIGSLICKVYVDELKKMTVDLVWATSKLTQDDIDFNNRAVNACIEAGEDTKKILGEQL